MGHWNSVHVDHVCCMFPLTYSIPQVRLTTYQISYTYGDVVATLAMIETPTATAFRVDSDEIAEDADAPLSEEQKSEKKRLIESDLFLVQQKPITSKLRTAVKHLTAQGGRLARFRGLHVSIIYHALSTGLVSLLTGGSHSLLIRSAVAIVVAIALSRLQMTWTHIVISAPSTKRWWRRFPSVKAGKNIVIPTAIWATAVQAACYIPHTLFLQVRDQLQNPSAYGNNVETVQKIALGELFMIGLIAVGSVLLIVIPADVTLKRVQASMLPEEDESIVPFDRTFAGKVVPAIVGGTGCVSMLDAWKTFDRSARIRLIKLYVKIFAIQAMTTLMFIFIMVSELHLILGADLTKAVKQAHANLKAGH